MGFVLALVALVLTIVLWVTHSLDQTTALVLALLALAVMVSSYAEVSGWVGRR